MSDADNLPRLFKTRGKLVFRRLFEICQRLGFDVLPRHFYSEIPDIRHLRSDHLWRAPFDMAEINGSLDHQQRFLIECTTPYRAKLADLQIHKTAVQMNGGDGYAEIEADCLYCFVRHHRPKTIVQVGCGVSTAVCLLASRDEGYKPRIMCIEPYPTQFLKDAAKSKDIELVQTKLQNVSIDYFGRLMPGDLFFVDSSHTLGPCGEVSRIVLSILPKIRAGAYAHFHDICFPYDYYPHVLSSDLFFWHETALLYAFLCMNNRYSILASLSHLFHSRKMELLKCFPNMRPAGFVDGIMVKSGHYPSSIYLRT